MGLITKVVKVKWVTKTKKHYESFVECSSDDLNHDIYKIIF